MFLGEHTHSIDAKGRVAIPAKFRDKLTAGAIITRGLDNCLLIFAQHEWEPFAADLGKMSYAKANARAYIRHFTSGAAQVEFDAQGRVLVPEYLRTFARLKKEAVFIGLYDRIEVWDRESWERYRQKTEGAAAEIAEKLSELDI